MANRHERRRADRIEREIRTRIERGDGDHCSCCGTKFAHLDATYGGFVRDGSIAYVGTCCMRRLQGIYLMGTFSDRYYEKLDPGTGTGKFCSTDEAIAGITTVRKYMSASDSVLDPIAKKAGVAPRHYLLLNSQDSSWKSDMVQGKFTALASHASAVFR